MRPKLEENRQLPTGCRVTWRVDERGVRRPYAYQRGVGPIRSEHEIGTAEWFEDWRRCVSEPQMGQTVYDLIRTLKEHPTLWVPLAARTKADHTGFLNAFAADHGGDTVATFNGANGRKLIEEWRQRHWAHAPRRADLAAKTMQKLFKLALRKGCVDANPATDLDSLYAPPDRSAIIWEDDLFWMLFEEMPERAGRILLCGRYAGARRADAIAMQWSSWDGRRLKFQTAKSGYKTTAVAVVEPANRRFFDELPREHDEFMFCSRLGLPYTPDGFKRIFGRARKRLHDKLTARGDHERAAALMNRRFHDMRGSYATDLCKYGFENEQLARAMGWGTKRVEEIRARYVSKDADADDMLAIMEAA